MHKLRWAGALSLAAVAFIGLGGSGSCGSSPTAAGGTGAFGIVTINGQQKLYLPILEAADGGDGQIAVVDVGLGNGFVDGGVAALVKNIDLGSTDQASTTAGNTTVVVAAGTNTYKVWLIDPATDTVTQTLSLDPSLNGSSFSGGGGIVTGIAMDNANHRAVLSLWNGFAYLDLTTNTITGSVLSAPSENFGFDATTELLLAPFYDCGDTSLAGNGLADAGPPCGNYTTTANGTGGGTLLGSGLNIINLTTNDVYTYENPTAADPTNPLGSEPDSAAADPTTGLAVIASEGDDTEDILDLSKAVFDDSTMTFTAPLTIVPGIDLTGVAIEANTHLAFLEAEHTNEIALIDLNQLSTIQKAVAAGVAVPQGAYVDATAPDPVGDGSLTWENLGDPHGIAVTTSIQSNNPVGFVVTDQGQGEVFVERIDLQKMQGIKPSTAGGVLTAQDMLPAVTLLNATVLH